MKRCVIIFVTVAISSCSITKMSTTSSQEVESAIELAIDDFIKSSELLRSDSIFSLDLEDINSDIIGISIIGSTNKLYPSQKNKIGTNYPYFPTGYYEYAGKLFYWYDSTEYITEELINALAKFDQIDSSYINEDNRLLEFTIDDSKKAVHYYFCRNNLNRYKKLTTNKAMGYYTPPRINCNK